MTISGKYGIISAMLRFNENNEVIEIEYNEEKPIEVQQYREESMSTDCCLFLVIFGIILIVLLSLVIFSS